jgi:hypothetical protein
MLQQWQRHCSLRHTKLGLKGKKSGTTSLLCTSSCDHAAWAKILKEQSVKVVNLRLIKILLLAILHLHVGIFLIRQI